MSISAAVSVVKVIPTVLALVGLPHGCASELAGVAEAIKPGGVVGSEAVVFRHLISLSLKI
ncbi:hypothetical protein SPB21_03900 [Leptothoe sp. ISB3NOV94-8A]